MTAPCPTPAPLGTPCGVQAVKASGVVPACKQERLTIRFNAMAPAASPNFNRGHRNQEDVR